MRILGIDLKLSSAFRPQTDGQTEIVNKAIESYLRAECDAYQNNKDESHTRKNIPNKSLLYSTVANNRGEQIFLVDKIMDANPQTRQVLIRWTGYTPDEDTWEPIENIDSAIGLVLEFFDANPRKRFDVTKRRSTRRTRKRKR